MILNAPVWTPSSSEKQAAFHEVWQLKLNDPANQRALWLRFALLVSQNGFRRVSECWGVLFERDRQRELTKHALKQTYDISALSFDSGDGATKGAAGVSRIRLSDCILETRVDGSGSTKGLIRSKGSTLEWNLSFKPRQNADFVLLPPILSRSGLTSTSAHTVSEDLAFTGISRMNGETIHWEAAPGMQAHLSGTRQPHSWVWGHCNSFTTENGQPVEAVFEGLSTRPTLVGGIPGPQLSSFFFLYNGKRYSFNSLWKTLRCKSRNSLTDWEFQADEEDLSFKGQAKAELKDFAGLTYEDTNGSLLYCANSKLSSLRLHVYRRGKLEAALHSHGTTALEVVLRERNPYVPLVV